MACDSIKTSLCNADAYIVLQGIATNTSRGTILHPISDMGAWLPVADPEEEERAGGGGGRPYSLRNFFQ